MLFVVRHINLDLLQLTVRYGFTLTEVIENVPLSDTATPYKGVTLLIGRHSVGCDELPRKIQGPRSEKCLE